MGKDGGAPSTLAIVGMARAATPNLGSLHDHS
jgi:hypothetical protein